MSELSASDGSERYGACVDDGQHRVCLDVAQPPSAFRIFAGRCPTPHNHEKLEGQEEYHHETENEGHHIQHPYLF